MPSSLSRQEKDFGTRRCTGHGGSVDKGEVIIVPDTYPATLTARLDEPVSGWMWLVKWLLLIPHIILLAFLWVAFIVTSFIAMWAIVFTGRYPRGIFDFNLGVMRWTWRVSYYGYSALATEKYPPFSLGEHPDYPVQFTVQYPQTLSRGKALIKWWLLAIPHYLVLRSLSGAVTILAIIASVTVAFRQTYPQQVFDFIMGINRWSARVSAYAALMTDDYPPFRLDMGGQPA
jgi:hypothetical protein